MKYMRYSEISNISGNQNENFEGNEIFDGRYCDSELVIGLVCAVGTEHNLVIDIIKERLKNYRYNSEVIRVSQDVISKIYEPKNGTISEYERIKELMNLGNKAREISKDNAILALGSAWEIASNRELDEEDQTKPRKRTAFIINSLKHPEEVERLREIYSSGFHLISIHSEEKKREDYLVYNKGMTREQAKELISIDADEFLGHGQHTRDTFQMADFFIDLSNNFELVRKSIWRILDLIFGNPVLTPTFDEYAMFMSFASSLRSADLSRQVGAVIAKDKEIIASGANDCPKAGGGLYWPELDLETNEIKDYNGGRDYTRGYDSNKIEQAKIIDDIVKLLGLKTNEEIEELKEKLKKSRIKELTEYGRVVHAEMEALLMCSRNNVSTRGATLYCTTFPCHNCAKHIIAAGIKRVVYIEPYPKSKAFDFHKDAISAKIETNNDIVEFLPFVGVGPRRFFELFSTSLGAGYKIIRKDKNGYTVKWGPESGRLRVQLLPCSYLDREMLASKSFFETKERLKCQP